MPAPRARRASRVSAPAVISSLPSESSPVFTRARTVLLVCCVALVFNFSSITLSPPVWTDETLFADPAINLASGDGFHSAHWPQPKEQVFAGNTPLYSLLLALWLK